MQRSSKLEILPQKIACLEKDKQPKMVFNWNVFKSTKKKSARDTADVHTLNKDENQNVIATSKLAYTEETKKAKPQNGLKPTKKRKRYPPPPHIAVLESLQIKNQENRTEPETNIMKELSTKHVLTDETEKPPPLPKSPPPTLEIPVKQHDEGEQVFKSSISDATIASKECTIPSESNEDVFDGKTEIKSNWESTTPLYSMGDRFRTVKKHIRRGSVELLRSKFSSGSDDAIKDSCINELNKMSLSTQSLNVDSLTFGKDTMHLSKHEPHFKDKETKELSLGVHDGNSCSVLSKPDANIAQNEEIERRNSDLSDDEEAFEEERVGANLCIDKGVDVVLTKNMDYVNEISVGEEKENPSVKGDNDILSHLEDLDNILLESEQLSNTDLKTYTSVNNNDELCNARGQSRVTCNEDLSDTTDKLVTSTVGIVLPTSNTRDIHEHTLTYMHHSSPRTQKRIVKLEQTICDVNFESIGLQNKQTLENKPEIFEEHVSTDAEVCSDAMNKDRADVCLSLPEDIKVNEQKRVLSINNENTSQLDNDICQPSITTQIYKTQETDTVSSNNTSTSGYESSLLYTPPLNEDEYIFESLLSLTEDSSKQNEETRSVTSLILERSNSSASVHNRPTIKPIKRSSVTECDASSNAHTDNKKHAERCEKNEDRHVQPSEIISDSDDTVHSSNTTRSSINDAGENTSDTMEVESFETFLKRKTLIEEVITVDKASPRTSGIYPINESETGVYYVEDHKGDVYKIEDITDQETVSEYSDIEADGSSSCTTGSVRSRRLNDGGLSRHSGSLNLDTAREVISAVYGISDESGTYGNIRDNKGDDSSYRTVIHIPNADNTREESFSLHDLKSVNAAMGKLQSEELVDHNANTITFNTVQSEINCKQRQNSSHSLVVEKGSPGGISLSDSDLINNDVVINNAFLINGDEVPVPVAHQNVSSSAIGTDVSTVSNLTSKSSNQLLELTGNSSTSIPLITPNQSLYELSTITQPKVHLGFPNVGLFPPYGSPSQAIAGVSYNTGLPATSAYEQKPSTILPAVAPLGSFIDNCDCNIETNSQCTTIIHLRQNTPSENTPQDSLSGDIKYNHTTQTLNTNHPRYGNNQDTPRNVERVENETTNTYTISSNIASSNIDRVISDGDVANRDSKTRYNTTTFGAANENPKAFDSVDSTNVDYTNSPTVNLVTSDSSYSTVEGDYVSMGNSKSRRTGSYTLSHFSPRGSNELYQSFNRTVNKPSIVHSTPEKTFTSVVNVDNKSQQSTKPPTGDTEKTIINKVHLNGDVPVLREQVSEKEPKSHIVLTEHPTKTEITINPELRNSQRSSVRNYDVVTSNSDDSESENAARYSVNNTNSVRSESFYKTTVNESVQTNKSGPLYRSNSDIKLNTVSRISASASLPTVHTIGSPTSRLHSSTLLLNKPATVDIENTNEKLEPTRFKTEAVLFVKDPVIKPIRVQEITSAGTFGDTPVRSTPSVTQLHISPQTTTQQREIIINGSHLGGPQYDRRTETVSRDITVVQRKGSLENETKRLQSAEEESAPKSYEINDDPVDMHENQEKGDIKVVRGNILIRNKLDSQEEDELDNINLFDQEFTLNKLNPLYQSDPDIYKSLQNELQERDRKQEEFRSQVTQDITFEQVDKVARSPQSNVSGQQKSKKTLSQLLLSKLSTIDRNDIHQHIDVEHTNEEIYGDINFLHADGSKGASNNTQNFDSVSENVELMMKEGKALIEIKVTAERYMPIDYEFNVWRKSAAIVKRHIEIDLFANKQRKRLYEHYMSRSNQSAIGDGSISSHGYQRQKEQNETVLSSIETLKLFGQLFDVADGAGDSEQKYMQSTDSVLPIEEMDAGFMY